MEKIKFYLKKFLEILSPAPSIDGLEISDSSLRFLHLGQNQKAASLRLPQGMIESGVIKNRDLFIKALEQLRKQINLNARTKIHVIVTLSDVNIYTQVFRLPPLADANLKEAVELNLQVISPLAADKGYTSWAVIGVTPTGEYEIIGAFIDKQIVDNLSLALDAMGFELMALEFQAISLGRLIRNKLTNLNPSDSHVVFRLFSGGLGFFVIQNGQIYFDYLLKWNAVLGGARQLTEDIFKNTIIEEVRRVTNFYGSRFGVRMEKLVLISEFDPKNVSKIIKDDLGIDTIDLQLPKFPKVTRDWWTVLGAGNRGQESRLEDTEINMAGIKRTSAFYKDKTMVIIRFWEKVIWGALTIMVGIFFVSNMVISKEADRTFMRYQISSQQKEPANAKELEEGARKFNRLVVAAEQLQKVVNDWVPVMEAFLSISSSGVTELDKITLSGLNQPVNVIGVSNSQEEVINFKKIIENHARFKNVILSIQNIVQRQDGKWLFQMTFQLE